MLKEKWEWQRRCKSHFFSLIRLENRVQKNFLFLASALFYQRSHECCKTMSQKSNLQVQTHPHIIQSSTASRACSLHTGTLHCTQSIWNTFSNSEHANFSWNSTDWEESSNQRIPTNPFYREIKRHYCRSEVNWFEPPLVTLSMPIFSGIQLTERKAGINGYLQVHFISK